MAIEGDLHEMNLPTLMQLILHDGGQAKIQLQQNDEAGVLYLENGRLVHAITGNKQRTTTQVGEEAIYELLKWRTGKFIVERNIPPPTHSIQQTWDYLLMEGLRQQDELSATESPLEEDVLSDMLKGLSTSDAAAIQQLVAQQEVQMASKSEQIQIILRNAVSSSTDIVGAVVVDKDGLLLGSMLNGTIDSNRVAAVSAGLMSLATRSAQQLGQGEVNQTLIQAKDGNIIAMRAGSQASFVALTPTGVNLGMAFLECREAADAIAGVF